MSAAVWDTAGSVLADVTRRWQTLDPLLPEPSAPGPDCGAELIVAGADGQPAAIGACEHWAGAPGSLELTWGAARRFRLSAWTSGPDVPGALDQLLSLWGDHLSEAPGADGADTAAVVTWASRDVGGVRTLLRHGLTPLAVVAARPTGRRTGRSDRGAEGAGGHTPAGRPDLSIRRAGPSDIDAIVRLGLEVVRFDAHFGPVIERPETAAALHREFAGLLAGPETWTWLAERDGIPVGMLAAERPESADWIAPMVRQAPVAYLFLMFVSPTERGRGVGAAMAERLHHDAEAAGVAVTLLHYAQTNPLSAPFWSQQGYRPLWTSWEAWPARTIR
jgi:GNAT superfamily N-acetyltransferase